MKQRLYYYNVFFKNWKIYHKRRKEKQRVNAYYKNTHYRKSLRKFFRGWRDVSHQWGKDRIKREEVVFRKNMETEKLTMWTSKVDQLMLYMA